MRKSSRNYDTQDLQIALFVFNHVHIKVHLPLTIRGVGFIYSPTEQEMLDQRSNKEIHLFNSKLGNGQILGDPF